MYGSGLFIVESLGKNALEVGCSTVLDHTVGRAKLKIDREFGQNSNTCQNKFVFVILREPSYAELSHCFP